MAAAVNDLVTKFSFVGSLKPQENFNSNLKASLGLLGGLAVGIVSATTLFAAWTTSVTESIDPMVQLSRETDVTIASIQELGFAASQNGSSLDAVQSSIRELTKRAGEFARTGAGPAAEAFLQLGISVRDSAGNMKTADVIMTDLSGTLQSFNKAEQADILDKLGIDPSMIQLLNQSSKAMNELREKARALGTITKEQADAAASLNDSNTTLKFGMQALQNQIATGFAPVMQGITESTIDFLIANKDLIKNGINALGKGLIVAMGFVKRMTPVVLGVAAAFGIWKIANIGVAATLGLIFAPAVLIAAGIAAIALVVDDLIVAFNGGNSVIRDFIMQWTGFDIVPALKAGVEMIKKFSSAVVADFIRIRDLLFGVFSGIGDIWAGDFSSGFGKLKDSLFGFIKLLKGTFIGAFSFIADQFSQLIPGFVSDLFKDESLAQASGFSGGRNGAVNNGVTNNSQSTANINQTNSISVYSSSPEQAGQAVYSYQNRQLKETRSYYNRGGL